ncbi:MAG: hypothetical protein MUC39_02840 [Candidatus Omnitrophica bacterium]|jgi:hypothetical protein|nr:hypothetical protein [Candidatus Omnitrophota bacterium]
MIDFLERINNEVITIFHHLDLFRKTSEIINKNTRLASMDSTLLIWMRKAFTIDLVMGIGRICDTDKRTQSLVRFLHELKNHPEFLTRHAYIQLYKSENAIMLGLANRDFDSLAGLGEQLYGSERIDIDIKQLVEEDPCKKIRDFRDQYVAHSDAIKDEQPPTYNDLFASFEVIKEIVKKYNLLLRAVGMVDLTPVMQGNWEEVLTIPWIKKEGLLRG